MLRRFTDPKPPQPACELAPLSYCQTARGCIRMIPLFTRDHLCRQFLSCCVTLTEGLFLFVQTGMELRVLHTAAFTSTWYGRWGYAFGRGGYNLQPANWEAAAEQLHAAPLADVLHDFRDIDRAIVAIIRRYRVRLWASMSGPGLAYLDAEPEVSVPSADVCVLGSRHTCSSSLLQTSSSSTERTIPTGCAASDADPRGTRASSQR